MEEDEQTYRIVRKYFNDSIPYEVVAEGQTLEQAQAHCSNPETSSKTCTTEAGLQRTRDKGEWFDVYYRE